MKHFWLPCLGLIAVHPRDAKSNLPTCEIRISPRGRTERREETSLSGPRRILFDWVLHARPLIACNWWRKALEAMLNLQCIMGSWPMLTKSCLCLVAVLLSCFVFFFIFLRRWEYLRPVCVCRDVCNREEGKIPHKPFVALATEKHSDPSESS